MPRDCNGAVLKVGDKVLLRGTVTDIVASEENCNVTVESELPCKPGDNKTLVSCNAAQFEKIPAGPDSKSPEPAAQPSKSGKKS